MQRNIERRLGTGSGFLLRIKSISAALAAAGYGIPGAVDMGIKWNENKVERGTKFTGYISIYQRLLDLMIREIDPDI